MRLKLRQALRPVTGASLAGDGLLVRLRSTTIAMLGVVVAVGLALVAVASQMGWPSVLSGPLPQAPGPGFARNATIVAPALPVGDRGSTGGSHRGHAGSPPASASPTTFELIAANAVAAPPPAPPPPPRQPKAPESGGNDTPSTPAPSPAPSPPASEPAPTETAPPSGETPSSPVAAAPESSPGHSGESHGHRYGDGPPPWAGGGSSDSSSDDESWGHGHDDHSWGHGHDDQGGGWGHH